MSTTLFDVVGYDQATGSLSNGFRGLLWETREPGTLYRNQHEGLVVKVEERTPFERSQPGSIFSISASRTLGGQRRVAFSEAATRSIRDDINKAFGAASFNNLWFRAFRRQTREDGRYEQSLSKAHQSVMWAERAIDLAAQAANDELTFRTVPREVTLHPNGDAYYSTVKLFRGNGHVGWLSDTGEVYPVW